VETAQRKAELEEAERRREAEKVEEAARREIEAERWREKDRLRREEGKLRTEELQWKQRLDAARLKAETSLLGRTKKIAEIVKNVIPSQPSENAELPAFFDSVENLFKLYEISNDPSPRSYCQNSQVALAQLLINCLYLNLTVMRQSKRPYFQSSNTSNTTFSSK